MKRKIIALTSLAACLITVMSTPSPAQAATQSSQPDYQARLTSGNTEKGSVGITRDGSSYGTAQATAKKLSAGSYNVVLDVKAYDYINQQSNSLTVNVCTLNVARNNAPSGCSNSSIDLPYGEGLTGVAKFVRTSGRVAAQGTLVANNNHAPRVLGGHSDHNSLDIYGEHLGSTTKVYFQEDSAAAVSSAFQIKNDNWIHVTAPPLPYTHTYDVRVVTPNGQVTLDGWYTSIPPAPVITSVSPSTLSQAGGQVLTVKGQNIGYLYNRTPFPISIGGVKISNSTVVSSSEIKFTTPPHAAGPVTLSITCYGGNASYSLKYA